MCWQHLRSYHLQMNATKATYSDYLMSRSRSTINAMQCNCTISQKVGEYQYNGSESVKFHRNWHRMQYLFIEIWIFLFIILLRAIVLIFIKLINTSLSSKHRIIMVMHSVYCTHWSCWREKAYQHNDTEDEWENGMNVCCLLVK